MADAPRLQTQAERLAALIDRLSADFARELQSVLRTANRELSRLVRDVLRPDATGKRRQRIQVALAVARRDQLRRVLARAGYDDLMGVMAERALQGVLRTQVARDVLAVVTGDVAQRFEVLEALRAGVLETLLAEGDVVARRLYQAVLRGVVTGADRETVLDGLATTLGKADTDLRTLYDTSTSIFTRQGQVLDAEDAPGFLYAGPVDARLRPFCEQHVGKVYSLAAIKQMDNGQLPNVLLTGGGYNCRHVWQPIAKASELEAYVDTGERLPEFAQALKTMPKLTRYGKRAA